MDSRARSRLEPSGTGELDNADVRHLLASACFLVLRDLPPEVVYHELRGVFASEARRDWFGEKRAEVLSQLLIQQARMPLLGSSWLALSERELYEGPTRPDRRWRTVFLSANLVHFRSIKDPLGLRDLPTAVGEVLEYRVPEGEWAG